MMVQSLMKILHKSHPQKIQNVVEMPAITINEEGAILHAMHSSHQSGRWPNGNSAGILDTAIAMQKSTF